MRLILSDVFPSTACQDARDCALTDAKQCGDHLLGYNVRFVHRSDLQYLNFCQYGIAVMLAFRGVCTALSRAVFHIVFLSPGKQMCRIATRWVITAMADKEANRNWAIGHHPRQPMRQPSHTRLGAEGNHSVTMLDRVVSNKWPTLIGSAFVHIWLKPVREWCQFDFSPPAKRATKANGNLINRCQWVFEFHAAWIVSALTRGVKCV